jgi:hypothetical protein
MPQEHRPLRVWTAKSCFEGVLTVGAGMRTLDHLNAVAQNFISLAEPRQTHGEGNLEDSDLVLNKRAILLLQELSPAPPRPGKNIQRLVQKSILIHVGPFELRGFLHVPAGMSPVKRFDQSHHPFLAVTSVLVEGPDGQTTSPFLALNREMIDAAQMIGQQQTAATPTPAGCGSTAD